jgi:hypothetical protein
VTGNDPVQIQYRHTGDVSTLTGSDLAQSIYTMVTTFIHHIYDLFNSTVNRSHYIALNDKMI